MFIVGLMPSHILVNRCRVRKYTCQPCLSFSSSSCQLKGKGEARQAGICRFFNPPSHFFKGNPWSHPRLVWVFQSLTKCDKKPWGCLENLSHGGSLGNSDNPLGMRPSEHSCTNSGKSKRVVWIKLPLGLSTIFQTF